MTTTPSSTRSWGTALSAHSVSTSGSIGSPSSRTEQPTTTVATTCASDSAFIQLNNLDIHGDDDHASQEASGYCQISLTFKLIQLHGGVDRSIAKA